MRFLKFLIKRLLLMIPIAIFVSLVIFLAIRIPDIDPISIMGGDKTITEETRAVLTERYNLDKPSWSSTRCGSMGCCTGITAWTSSTGRASRT